eukprot:CAMPEP_0198721084 /NCGR_PEP_ID=MMETSP1471-20131121/64704_1 /TAXON_ID=41880 /ORGANISM="Pycnococcus provasolii, Strain RCC733" /LENGTH=361 /DNA_ID=CAMNT_0044481965 /DNA_START=108 /DNA_END=1196 /DNA_ORIENTATION=-
MGRGGHSKITRSDFKGTRHSHSVFDGLGGVNGFKLFGTTPPYVDLRKSPGHTSMASEVPSKKPFLTLHEEGLALPRRDFSAPRPGDGGRERRLGRAPAPAARAIWLGARYASACPLDAAGGLLAAAAAGCQPGQSGPVVMASLRCAAALLGNLAPHMAMHAKGQPPSAAPRDAAGQPDEPGRAALVTGTCSVIAHARQQSAASSVCSSGGALDALASAAADNNEIESAQAVLQLEVIRARQAAWMKQRTKALEQEEQEALEDSVTATTVVPSSATGSVRSSSRSEQPPLNDVVAVRKLTDPPPPLLEDERAGLDSSKLPLRSNSTNELLAEEMGVSVEEAAELDRFVNEIQRGLPACLQDL